MKKTLSRPLELNKGFHKEYRYHHNTRYEKARDAKSILEEIRSKRMKNTECNLNWV